MGGYSNWKRVPKTAEEPYKTVQSDLDNSSIHTEKKHLAITSVYLYLDKVVCIISNIVIY